MVCSWLSSLTVFLLLHQFKPIVSQGCSNTCPPINFGTPVPALCEGDYADTFADIKKEYYICHPGSGSFTIESLKRKISVFANFYTGCNAGRRESGVFAHVAQRFYELYGKDNVVFIQSIKGGGTCEQWANIYQRDASSLYPNSSVTPNEMPWSVNDVNYEIRDDLFTAPFGHPGYIILDPNLKVRHKFIGPCCGYESYYDCIPNVARELDQTLTDYLMPLLSEFGRQPINDEVNEPSGNVFDQDDEDTDIPTDCGMANDITWSEWSPCSISCGETEGIQFRHSNSIECKNIAPVQTKSCQAESPCDSGSCITDLGATWKVETVESGLNSPRDVDFHPTPGLHLGTYSEGRTFHPDMGLEAWVVNGGNHSVSIVASLGTQYQTTVSRRDRGYYHYMINATALSFNKVGDTTRTEDRDGFNYWAICNDNLNTYIDTKEANYFMGPTLYNSQPSNRNIVNRLGENCRPEEPCYFLHSDMLHESPGCIGITHDPEVSTAYGNVYWVFDATGNQDKGQLVRFDFQQPHGPGSMDHSIAAVRRYVEIELESGPPGVHAGMVVHPTRRQVYIAVPGSNKILVVEADSGNFARTAREEYPIFSNRLPSFEYSIWECVEQRVFVDDIQMPSGMALSNDGERLFVAERGTGKILVYEIDSGGLLESVQTEFSTIGGMTMSPETDLMPSMLYFVDENTNSLNRIVPTAECVDPIASRTNPSFTQAVSLAQEQIERFSLSRDYQCQVNPVVPDAAFFDQVHDDTGYADDNPNVQSNMTGMNAEAALLSNRTDCEPDSELNFDALLLGGYFCHQCLPEQDLVCDFGGVCSNVQWQGYICDNEFLVQKNDVGEVVLQNSNGTTLDPTMIEVKWGMTYRFTVFGELVLCASGHSTSECARKGPLLLTVLDRGSESVALTVEGEEQSIFEFVVVDIPPIPESPTSGLASGKIAGIVIATIIFLVIVARSIQQMCLNGNRESGKKNSSDSIEGGSSDSSPSINQIEP